MLEVKRIREEKDEVIKFLTGRGIEAKDMIEKVLIFDEERKQTQLERDNLSSKLNTLSKHIGGLFKENKKEEAEQLKKQTIQIKDSISRLEAKFNEKQEKLNKLLSEIPNIFHKAVPIGKNSSDNEVIYENGDTSKYKQGEPHWELAKRYDIIDLELGSKITGAGFPVYKNQGAKLQRALINFFLDSASKEGYSEFETPLLVNKESAFGTGQLPDKEGQMYHVQDDDLYLIPTAEIPLTNLYRDMILQVVDLPVKLVGYTPCFRREAGSYGKNVRGLNRVHQFDKVEIVQIQHPGKSYETLEEMRKYVEGLLQQLELPYRVVKLCSGDLTFSSAFTYDMEVYSSGQKKWLEVSSISNFETFQANRMKLRFKDSEGKIGLAHTLNGSALALPRIVAALLENNQVKEGIKVPKVLEPYTGFEKIN